MTDNTRTLLEKRASVVAEMRTLTAHTTELTDDQRHRNLDHELRGFSLVRAIAAQAGLAVDAGRERELSQEIARRAGRPFQGIAVPMAVFQQPIEQRVLATTAPAGGPGGNLVSTDYRDDQFIDLLRNALVVRGLGARVLSGLTGNVDIPRQKGSATAENAALSLSDLQFDKVSLAPKHAGCITELSRNMLMQASPDVEALVRADFAAVLAETLDKAAIAGTGTGNQPRGVLNTAGIGSYVAPLGGGFSSDVPIELISLPDAANAATGSLGFVSNSKVRKAAMKLSDADGRFLGLNTVFQGYAAAFSNAVPSNLGAGTNASALAYDVVQGNGRGGTGIPRRYLDGEVFHVRDRSEDGLVGRSRITRAARPLRHGSRRHERKGACDSADPSGLIAVLPAKSFVAWQRRKPNTEKPTPLLAE